MKHVVGSHHESVGALPRSEAEKVSWIGCFAAPIGRAGKTGYFYGGLIYRDLQKEGIPVTHHSDDWADWAIS